MPSAAFEFLTQVTTIFKHRALDKPATSTSYEKRPQYSHEDMNVENDFGHIWYVRKSSIKKNPKGQISQR